MPWHPSTASGPGSSCLSACRSLAQAPCTSRTVPCTCPSIGHSSCLCLQVPSSQVSSTPAFQMHQLWLRVPFQSYGATRLAVVRTPALRFRPTPRILTQHDRAVRCGDLCSAFKEAPSRDRCFPEFVSLSFCLQVHLCACSLCFCTTGGGSSGSSSAPVAHRAS